MNRLLKSSLFLSVILIPSLALAQSVTFNSTLLKISDIIKALSIIIVSIAVLVFMWGILKYVIAKDEESQKEARGVMLYGIIVIFVMVSVVGLVNVLKDSIGLSNTALPAPALQLPNTIR